MSSDEIARSVEILFSPGDVVELRTFKDGTTFSGYFDDHQELAKAAAKHDERGHDVYITLNKLPEEIAYRRYNRIERMKGRDASTSDKDVERRTFLFIDADCERVAGISSTDEEKRKSREKVLEIRDYLRAQGWPEPIVCDSGNGYHLLYPIDLPADEAGLELISGVLEALDFKFSDESVKVDTTTKNAARITKFYGTVAKKGDNRPQRPHRPSKILEVPEALAPVSREHLQQVADTKPEEPRGFRVYPGGKGPREFDVADWIAQHGVQVKREGPWKNGGYRWILEACPWNGHTDNAAYIVRQPGGAIAAGCQHNSCEGYTWRDLREHYEPGAYDRKDWSEEKARRRDNNDNSDNKFQDLADLPDPEDFPISALPITLRQFVREAAASVGCPVDYIGLSTLAAVSAAIGDTRRIKIKKDWTEGPAIFGMIVGGPASKKTPAMNLALRPVRERQMALKAEYERQKEEHEAALRDYEKAKKDGPSGLRKPEKPALVRTYADDTTVERLADILNENLRGLLIIKDELSGWLGAMNQYKQGGKGADRQFWLSVHTNQPVSVDRKSTDEPVIVARPFVSIVGGIQPEVLPDFGKDRGDGLIDRFIPVYPKPQVGRWSDDEISDHVREGYARTISSLYKLRHANDEEDPFPSRVPMTSEAKALFVAEYNRLHDELEAPGFPQRLRPAWGKLEAYFARFALILAMARVVELGNQGRGGAAENVTRDDMAGAVKLLAYFKNHVRRVYTGLYGDSPSDRLAADLRDFLIAQGGAWEGIASELYEALDSDYKPERVKDFGKLIRGIAKRSPLLRLEDLQRTNTRRPFRLTLESVDTVVTVVTPSRDEGPAGAGWEWTV
jgi:Protein of unknown function (DUF3987)